MKKIFIALTLALAATSAFAVTGGGPWMRYAQDPKFPQSKVVDLYVWASPALANTTVVKTYTNVGLFNATPSLGATTITTFSAQPDYPRNLVLTPGGSLTAFAAGTAVVTGTNIYGNTITENFTIGNGQSSAVTGAKAFKTITSLVFPATNFTGAAIAIGTGSKLGVVRCTHDVGDYAWSVFNNVFETTRGTFASDPANVESNTFTPNGTMDGVKPVKIFYIQNYGCWPH